MATTDYGLTIAVMQKLMASPRLVDVIDDDGDGSLSADEQALVTDTSTGAAYRAGSVADSYLGQRYAIPLTGTQVTPALAHHVGMLCAHYLARRRPQYRDAEGRAPYAAEADEALAYFALLRDGRVALDPADTDAADASANASPYVTHAKRRGERVTSTTNPYRTRRW